MKMRFCCFWLKLRGSGELPPERGIIAIFCIFRADIFLKRCGIWKNCSHWSCSSTLIRFTTLVRTVFPISNLKSIHKYHPPAIRPSCFAIRPQKSHHGRNYCRIGSLTWLATWIRTDGNLGFVTNKLKYECIFRVNSKSSAKLDM